MVRNYCPPPSTALLSISIIKRDLFCALSVGPFASRKERVRDLFFLFLGNCFLELHGICSISANNQYDLVWQYNIPFGSFQRSLEGG